MTGNFAHPDNIFRLNFLANHFGLPDGWTQYHTKIVTTCLKRDDFPGNYKHREKWIRVNCPEDAQALRMFATCMVDAALAPPKKTEKILAPTSQKAPRSLPIPQKSAPKSEPRVVISQPVEQPKTVIADPVKIETLMPAPLYIPTSRARHIRSTPLPPPPTLINTSKPRTPSPHGQAVRKERGR
jgi:hypothetical protein